MSERKIPDMEAFPVRDYPEEKKIRGRAFGRTNFKGGIGKKGEVSCSQAMPLGRKGEVEGRGGGPLRGECSLGGEAGVHKKGSS